MIFDDAAAGWMCNPQGDTHNRPRDGRRRGPLRGDTTPWGAYLVRPVSRSRLLGPMAVIAECVFCFLLV